MKSVIRTIWTIGHRPFTLGGHVYYPLGCKVECTGPHDIGAGYKGYVAKSPSGKTFVAEASTGAIVGATLKAVRHDIETGDPKTMRIQVKEAKAQMAKVEVREPEFFWSALNAK